MQVRGTVLLIVLLSFTLLSAAHSQPMKPRRATQESPSPYSSSLHHKSKRSKKFKGEKEIGSDGKFAAALNSVLGDLLDSLSELEGDGQQETITEFNVLDDLYDTISSSLLVPVLKDPTVLAENELVLPYKCEHVVSAHFSKLQHPLPDPMLPQIHDIELLHAHSTPQFSYKRRELTVALRELQLPSLIQQFIKMRHEQVIEHSMHNHETQEFELFTINRNHRHIVSILEHTTFKPNPKDPLSTIAHTRILGESRSPLASLAWPFAKTVAASHLEQWIDLTLSYLEDTEEEAQ